MLGLDDPAAAGLTGETTMVVQALDLGLVVPASVFIAVLTWRRSPVGYALAAVAVVALVAMAGAISGMLLSALAFGAAFGETVVPLAIFGAFAVAGTLIGIQMYRSVRQEVFRIGLDLEIRGMSAPVR